MKQLKTIKLKGKDYVQVKDRVEYFNETFPNGMITTKAYMQPTGECLFVAKVVPDVEKPRYFNGSSYGAVKGEKALEKLETVAVGRALAFMGIGVVESLASADEISTWNASKPRTSHPGANKAYSEMINPANYLNDTKTKLQFKHVKGCKSSLFQLPDGSWACENQPCNQLNK